MSKQGFILAFVGIVLGLLILGASPFYVVDVTQNAIVVQLGKPVRNVTEGGPLLENAVHRGSHLLR